MLRTVSDAPTLWESVIPECLMGLPGDLGEIDVLLDDPRFFEPFRAFFDPTQGRPSIPMETYLRMMFLKYRYRLGFEPLCAEVVLLQVEVASCPRSQPNIVANVPAGPVGAPPGIIPVCRDRSRSVQTSSGSSFHRVRSCRLGSQSLSIGCAFEVTALSCPDTVPSLLTARLRVHSRRFRARCRWRPRRRRLD